jgi:hypothetical protein
MPDDRKKGDRKFPLPPRSTPKTMCPYLSDPFEECLCRDMGSLIVLKIIRLCGGEFEACEIYRRRGPKRGTGSEGNG